VSTHVGQVRESVTVGPGVRRVRVLPQTYKRWLRDYHGPYAVHKAMEAAYKYGHNFDMTAAVDGGHCLSPAFCLPGVVSMVHVGVAAAAMVMLAVVVGLCCGRYCYGCCCCCHDGMPIMAVRVVVVFGGGGGGGDDDGDGGSGSGGEGWCLCLQRPP